MVSPKFSAEKKERQGLGVVGLIQGAVAATMKCFFGCFRSRDSHSRLVSSPEHSDENSLSTLFFSGDDSFGREDLTPLTEELDANELVNEAKFLKACGTLLETPIEIRKIWKRVNTSPQTEVAKSSSFKSWLPNSSSEKQVDELPVHVHTRQEWVAGTDLLDGTPESFLIDENSERKLQTKSCQNNDIQNATVTDVSDNKSRSPNSSVSSEDLPMSILGKCKSVRFECEPDNKIPSPGSSNQSLKQSGSAGNHSPLKASPYPTPLKISDEMQTPGTVFPAYMDNMAASGKPGRIRSQYVYTCLNRTSIQSQWKEIKDENFDPNNNNQSLESNLEELPTSTPSLGMSVNDLLLGKYGKAEAERTSPGARPILGTVGSEPYWHDDVNLHIPTKSWDGNGIPNTTNKYKEDRKVSWHATPFEERLEKVLSEETCNPKRKHVDGIPLAELNENEESDAGSSSTTTTTTTTTSAHHNPKQLVSFY